MLVFPLITMQLSLCNHSTKINTVRNCSHHTLLSLHISFIQHWLMLMQIILYDGWEYWFLLCFSPCFHISRLLQKVLQHCVLLMVCSSRCKVSCLGTSGALYNKEQGVGHKTSYKDWKKVNRMNRLGNSSNNTGSVKSWSYSLPAAWKRNIVLWASGMETAYSFTTSF